MKVALNQCYVLHRRPFLESSLLLEIFSHEHGRLPLVHRGARKLKRGRHAIQPFQMFLFSWSGRGEIATASRCEAAGPAVLVDSTTCLSGFYINELLHRLLHRHEPHPELFAEYDRCLRALAGDGGNQQHLRYFELELLNALGYGPILEHDSAGLAVDPEKQYHYLPEQGPVLGGHEAACAVSGSTLLQLAKRSPLGSTALYEARILMRYLLQQQMQGQPLASRGLYREYLRANNHQQGDPANPVP